MSKSNTQFAVVATVPSTSGSATYKVSIHKMTGQWACSCKGWIFRHKDCKHIVAEKSSMPLLARTAA